MGCGIDHRDGEFRQPRQTLFLRANPLGRKVDHRQDRRSVLMTQDPLQHSSMIGDKPVAQSLISPEAPS